MQSEHACLLVCMRLFVFAWRVWWDIWCDRRCNEHFEMKNESSGFKRILPAKLIKLNCPIISLSHTLFDLSLSFSLCLRHHALGLLTHLDTKNHMASYSFATCTSDASLDFACCSLQIYWVHPETDGDTSCYYHHLICARALMCAGHLRGRHM